MWDDIQGGAAVASLPEDRQRRVEHGVRSRGGPHIQSEWPRAAVKLTCVDVPEAFLKAPVK